LLALACFVGVASPGFAAGPSATSLLLRSGEMPGFAASGKSRSATSAEDFAAESDAGDASAEKKDLAAFRSDGFVAGAAQQEAGTGANKGAAGLSIGIVLESPSGAKRLLAYQLSGAIAAQGSGATIQRFAVPGLAGAQGFTATAKGRPGAAVNLFFTAGRCLLLVGDATTSAHPNDPVTTAAKTLYRRVSSSCS